MKDYIINYFILQNKITLIDLYNYIKIRYINSIEINDIKIELKNLIKKDIIICKNNEYELTKKDCSEILNKKYSYSKVSQSLYEDSPFNNKPITLPYKKASVKNLFDYFQKTESTISTNE